MKKSMYRELHEEVLDLDVVIYGDFFYHLGGIESWVYYTCKKYNKGQITIVFKNCDPDQLERFKTVADCVLYNGQPFHCRKVIYVAPIYIRDDNIYRGAEFRALVNHVCYGEAQNNEEFLNLPLDKVYAVSQTCLDSCKLKMPYDMEVLWNPIEPDEPKPFLRLISACRWSKDKGSEQMLKFADMLDKAGIQFLWLIFSDEEPEEHHQDMIFMKSRYNLTAYIKNSDLGIQFTRIEAYNNFTNECLKLGIPVVISDIPVFREIGIDESMAFFYDWEMNGPDVKELLKIPKVNYKLKDSSKEYEELLK